MKLYRRQQSEPNIVFEFLVMSFKLTHALTTFQRYVNRTLRSFLDVLFTTNLNDISIYRELLEDHIYYVWQILELLQKAGLQIKQTQVSTSI
jgi:hypothetical protein